MESSQVINIAIFASGSGTNAENIIKYFNNKAKFCVVAVFTNNADAYVIKRAESLNVPVYVFSKQELTDSDAVMNHLFDLKVNYIVLAGFLLLMPTNIIENFRDKIINIHPALLPKYGGKGMYGDAVHKKVYEARESNTGITIHLVDEKYDNGKIIFQQKVPITIYDSPKTIASKVHDLEYIYFPSVIETFILGK